MSPPTLMMWLPLVLVQLLTNWSCCSLSVSGQLQRAGPRPSPKLETTQPAPPLLAVQPWPTIGSPPKEKKPKPAVLGSLVFAPGIPNAVMGVPASGFAVIGLYLNQPKRTSVNNELLSVLVIPVDRL